MAEPPEGPPGEPPGEPPEDLFEERRQERSWRDEETAPEPPDEPERDLDEEPRQQPPPRYGERPRAPDDVHAGEPHDHEPPERGGGHDEPSPQAPGERGEEEPPERGARFSDLRERSGRLFGARPPAGEGHDHPTGELIDDELEEPTGEFFEEHGDHDGRDEEPLPHDDYAEDAPPSPPTGELLLDLGEQVHSPTELAARRAQERAVRRRAGRQRLLALIVGIVVIVVIVVVVTGGGGGTPSSNTASGNPLAAAGKGAGHLAFGSAAAALPGNILVADRNNHRVLVISPQGQVVWSAVLAGPSSAFLSPTGRSITVTQPGAFVVLALGVKDRKAFYRYGHSGHAGSSANHLHDPETAQELSDGQLVIADKSNCRVIFIAPPAHRPTTTLGKPSSCVHAPPKTLAYPTSVFPAIGGGVVVTEADPKWVDVLSPTNSIVASMQVPGLSAPLDANEYAPGKLIATSHTHPGVVEEFDTADKVSWTYNAAFGTGELNRPSLAEVLPGGDVLVCDSGNDRIIVIDPQTMSIVWQYGHDGKPGSQPGYLHTPDTAVLVSSSS